MIGYFPITVPKGFILLIRQQFVNAIFYLLNNSKIIFLSVYSCITFMLWNFNELVLVINYVRVAHLEGSMTKT